MKIAIFVESFPKISETFILNQIIGLIELGHEVEIFADHDPKERFVQEEINEHALIDITKYSANIIPRKKLRRVIHSCKLIFKYSYKFPKIILKSLNVFKYQRTAWSLKSLYYICYFLEKDFDVVNCHFGPNALRYLFLKEILGGRIIFLTTFHGYDLTKYLNKRHKDIYNKLFTEGDHFLPVSETWKQLLIKLGCKKEKISVFHMGVDLHNYTKLPSPEKINSSILRIITVGRLTEKKGIEYSIRAIAELNKKYNNLEYLIIGEGELRPYLESVITKLDLQNVKLCGAMPRNKAASLIAASDIFILTSVTSEDGDKEGIPVSIMEAMALSLPVISTNHSGIPELVENNLSGFLVPERNISQIVQKIEVLITKPELRKQFGLEGRKIIENKFNLRTINQRLALFLETLTTYSNFSYDNR